MKCCEPKHDPFEAVKKRLPSARSRRSYQTAWDRYLTWLESEKLHYLKARPRHVEAHLAHLQDEEYAKATIGHSLSVIREVYAACVRHELMKTNPAREVKLPAMSSTPRTPLLTEDQAKKLFELPAETWTEKRERVVVALLFGLGWRRSEVARLTVESFERMTVSGVVKGGKELTAAVPKWLWELVKEWRRFAGIDEGPLLTRGADDGEAISDGMVYLIVKNAAARAGLPEEIATPHALRRTNITLAGERGVSLKARQLAVGHTSQETTERYDHARDATKVAPGDVFEDLVRGGR